MTTWSAPGAAYTLTGHQALGEYEHIRKLWSSCTRQEHQDIIACLAAQARAQLRLSGMKDVTLQVDVAVDADIRAIANVTDTVRALLRGQTIMVAITGYEMAAIAEALADISIYAVEKAGISRADFALRCHALAATRENSK